MNKNKLHTTYCFILITMLASWLPVRSEVTIYDKVACKAGAFSLVYDSKGSISDLCDEVIERGSKNWTEKFDKCKQQSFIKAYETCLLEFPTIDSLTKEETELKSKSIKR